MLGHLENQALKDPSVEEAWRYAFPIRPGGRPLPEPKSLSLSHPDASGSTQKPTLISLTAYPDDQQVGSVGITTTRDALVQSLRIPDDRVVYVGKVLLSLASEWFRTQHNLLPLSVVDKEDVLRYVRKENPPPNFDLMIDGACTDRVARAYQRDRHTPVILDTKLLWHLLCMENCPIPSAQLLPPDLVQIAIGFTGARRVADARHVRRQDNKPPDYQPSSEELFGADQARSRRYLDDQRIYNDQYRIPYDPHTIYNGLHFIVDTTFLTPEQQVEKIVEALTNTYGANPTAMQALGLTSFA